MEHRCYTPGHKIGWAAGEKGLKELFKVQAAAIEALGS